MAKFGPLRQGLKGAVPPLKGLRERRSRRIIKVRLSTRAIHRFYCTSFQISKCCHNYNIFPRVPFKVSSAEKTADGCQVYLELVGDRFVPPKHLRHDDHGLQHRASKPRLKFESKRGKWQNRSTSRVIGPSLNIRPQACAFTEQYTTMQVRDLNICPLQGSAILCPTQKLRSNNIPELFPELAKTN